MPADNDAPGFMVIVTPIQARYRSCGKNWNWRLDDCLAPCRGGYQPPVRYDLPKWYVVRQIRTNYQHFTIQPTAQKPQHCGRLVASPTGAGWLSSPPNNNLPPPKRYRALYWGDDYQKSSYGIAHGGSPSNNNLLKTNILSVKNTPCFYKQGVRLFSWQRSRSFPRECGIRGWRRAGNPGKPSGRNRRGSAYR